MLYSFLPVLYFGILDQSVRASTANTYPQSYYVGQQGRHLNLQQMCMWECKALLHAGLISLLTFNAWGVASSNPYAEGAGSITTHADGSDADMYTVGAAVNFMVVVTVNAKLLLSMNAHTRPTLSCKGLVDFCLSLG